jgi:hypothetical protein
MSNPITAEDVKALNAALSGNAPCSVSIAQPPQLARTFEDAYSELKEGEFCALVRTTHALAMLLPVVSVSEHVQQEINKYLAILPEGTEQVSVERLPVTTLAVEHVVVFRNPLMQDIKRVELQWMHAGTVIDDQFKTYNLITGINYYDRDKGQMFLYSTK